MTRKEKRIGLVIVGLGLLIWFCIVAGKQLFTKSYKPQKADTCRTFCMCYLNPTTGTDTGAICIRITKDTSEKIDNGDDSYKKISKRDSLYFIPYLDTLRQNGRILYDTLKKARMTVNYRFYPAVFIIHDFDNHYPTAPIEQVR